MEHIAGQSRALEVLRASLRSGRVHHAYIFHGPPGVGKFTTALALARILLCHKPATDGAGSPRACGSCPSCLRLPEGARPDSDLTGVATTHPDLHVVVKELARFSDNPQVRERKLLTLPFDVLREALIEPVYRSTRMGPHKVFIVDEAELIDPRGQNILLKTLEEPPAGTFIVLVTAQEERLLPTIRSRCQRVAFVPLSEEDLAAWLEKRGAGLDARQRRWLLDFAGGSPGKAQLALEQNLLSWADAVTPGFESLARGHYPVELGRAMASCIDDFAKRKVERQPQASKEAANKQGAALMWGLMAQHARRALTEAAAGTASGRDEGLEGRLEPWLGVLETLEQTQRETLANVQLPFVCERLVSLMHRRLSAGIAAGA